MPRAESPRKLIHALAFADLVARSMGNIARAPVVLAFIAAYSRLACGGYDQYGELPINDMVLVTFAFDVHRDGSVHNIRVWRCSNPKDLSLADDA
jgi:hypothetical protein